MTELRLMGRWDLLPALNGDISRDPLFLLSQELLTLSTSIGALGLGAHEFVV